MVKSIKIIITTRSEEDAKVAYQILQQKLTAAHISHTGPIPFPHKRKKFVVNTSPHVYSKSKEEIFTILRKYIIQVKLKDGESLAFLTKDMEWCPASVSLTLKEVI